MTDYEVLNVTFLNLIFQCGGLVVNYAILILILPLAAFVIQIFFGRRLPRGGDWLVTGAMFLSLILSTSIFLQVFSIHDPRFKTGISFNWIDLGLTKIKCGILLDNVTAIMLMVVTIVSSFVFLFSIGYMHGDPRYSRYFAYLSLFAFSMLGLVLSDNMLTLYIFWELVGLSSYLLIGFWFEKKSASDAGKKAFITTRIGDVGMFIGILIIFSQVKVFGFEEIFSAVANGHVGGTLLTVAGVCIFAGAVGKSAQFPLHVWLPDAMEGPTPVSALIHAATMVAAGVYLVARMFPFFSPDALLIIAYIGVFTAVFAGTIALVQNDIKRVLAYSTISQLGYMMLGLGAGGYTAGLFHLMTHAFFKALLFLGSGSVIHAMHTQDIWEMGGLRKKMPITFLTFLIATFAITGIPGFSGFFSKDAILASALAFGMTNPNHLILFIASLLTVGITAFYMFRLIFVTFTGSPRDEGKYHHAHESPLVMTIPLVVLALLSISSGWGGWFKELIVKPDLRQYQTVVTSGSTLSKLETESNLNAVKELGKHDSVENAYEEAEHKSHMPAMFLSILLAALGILFSFLTYSAGIFSAEKAKKRLKPVYTLLYNKYYIDEIYLATVVRLTLLVNRMLAWFDMKVIDGIVNGTGWLLRGLSSGSGIFDLAVVDGAVNGLASIITTGGTALRRIQTGRIQSYVLGALAGALLILAFRAMIR